MKNHKIEKSILMLLAIFFVLGFQRCDFEAREEAHPNLMKSETAEFKSSRNIKLDPGFVEYLGDLPEACSEVCLVSGQHQNVGSVEVAVADDGLIVTIIVLSSEIYLEEVHLDVFTNEEEFFNSKKVTGGGAVPGQFAYQKHFTNDGIRTISVKVPFEYYDFADCVFIAAHAALSDGETAWAGDCNSGEEYVTLVNAEQFPGSNWSVYFDFCQDECTSLIDFTYAWEDLLNSGNDMDYNDLVIQSDVMISPSRMVIDFFAKARGAGYNHAFKVKIPMEGINAISGDQGYSNDGIYYYITVFPSTQDVLPGEGLSGGTWAANALPNDITCQPTATAQLVFDLGPAFIYNVDKPYEPFITVHPGQNNVYDLYIYEVSGVSTFTKGGKVYPNGILIPDDWKWPLERTIITAAYPDFSSIDTWNPNWAFNLYDPSKVWTCSE